MNLSLRLHKYQCFHWGDILLLATIKNYIQKCSLRGTLSAQVSTYEGNKIHIEGMVKTEYNSVTYSGPQSMWSAAILRCSPYDNLSVSVSLRPLSWEFLCLPVHFSFPSLSILLTLLRVLPSSILCVSVHPALLYNLTNPWAHCKHHWTVELGCPSTQALLWFLLNFSKQSLSLMIIFFYPYKSFLQNH